MLQCSKPGGWWLGALRFRACVGEGGPWPRRVGHGSPHEQFFFLKKFLLRKPNAYTIGVGQIVLLANTKQSCYKRAMFKSLPFTPRIVKATEQRLNAIYQAANLGLKGDSLALAAGMLPTEYRQLCQFDPMAEMAAQKGKADNELRAAQKLNEASEAGDAKASLAILQHVHGWTAKQEISVDVYQKISVLTALEQARARVIEGSAIIDEAPNRANGMGLLTNNDEDTSHGYQHSNANAA
jgi:hypothetical protein